jgi:hypothetical protein
MLEGALGDEKERAPHVKVCWFHHRHYGNSHMEHASRLWCTHIAAVAKISSESHMEHSEPHAKHAVAKISSESHMEHSEPHAKHA